MEKKEELVKLINEKRNNKLKVEVNNQKMDTSYI
jgi:hypothetical protein